MNTARRIWSILLPGQRRAAIVLFALVLVGTAIETVSVGLVVPALAFMSRGTQVSGSQLNAWLEWLGNPSPNRLIVLVLVGLLAVYAVKSVFLLFVAYWQSRFVAATQASTSRRLFAIYLAQPWTFHLQRQPAALFRTINESMEFSRICGLFLMTISEALVLSGLVGLLLWFEPTGAIVVAGMLGAAAWLFQLVSRPRARRWAETQQHHAKTIITQVQQTIGGAKVIKIRGCEREFNEQFRHHVDGQAKVMAMQELTHKVPRLWFELLAVAALLLLTEVMIWHGTPADQLIPMLGLFATVAFRMLPSVNHMTAAMSRLGSSEPLLESLVKELRLADSLPPAGSSVSMPFRDSITLENVAYRYPGGEAEVLSQISIRIPHGASAGFVGGSGAGKSTLVDVILGLLPPSNGRVMVDGDDIHANLRGWQNEIGYVPQSIYLCDESIRRNVAFGVPEDAIDDAAVRRALKAAQLDEYVASLPAGADTPVGERGMRLSGGQRQRIGIARALYHDPKVLVLDEATSALDTETEKGVMAAVNALHGTKTLIIVAHRLTTVADCDILFRLETGRVVQTGSFADVISP